MTADVLRRAAFALLAAGALQGCIANSVVLHVTPEGSGRAVITSRIYEPALHAYDSLFAEVPRHAKTEDQLPPPMAGELARQFGGPATLASTRLDKVQDGVVRTTVVEFPDITRLRLQFPPVFAMPSGGMFDLGGFSENPVISFAMKPHENGDRLLLVRLPSERIDNPGEPQMTVFETDSREERIFKRAIQTMAVRLFVELEGASVLRTNAPAAQGNRVTILDLDLDRIVNQLDEAKVRRSMTPGSMQEVLWQLGDMPGAVVPREHEVFLEFEPPQAAPAPQPAAQAPPPDTEIFLAPLKSTGESLEIGAPINITNNPGYDNQPFFSPDGRNIFFTSVRGPAPATGGGSLTQTDIYRYDIATRSVARVTQTPEGEYSPTVMLDGRRISVIRVEADGTQRLATITPSGPKVEVEVILPEVKPVGYHAWADEHTVAMFILGGNGAPATLQVADTRTGKAQVVATDIGRSVQRMPGSGTSRHISFVQRARDGDKVTLTIKELDPATGQITTLTPAVDGAREADTAWTPDGTLLMAKEATLYGWKRGQTGWKEVASLERLSLRSVTRLAVSPSGDHIALVASPRPPGER